MKTATGGGRIPLGRHRFQLGLTAVVLLVLLRMSIGVHFLYQGVWKVNHPEFSADGYLAQSKGPLAEYFLELLPDRLGQERLQVAALDPATADAENRYVRLNYAALAPDWDIYAGKFSSHYGLSEEQKQQAGKILASRKDQLGNYLSENGEAITTYLHEVERLKRNQQDEQLRDLAFQQVRIWDKRQELQAKSRPWLAQVDSIRADLVRDLHDVLDSDQRALGPLPQERTQLDWMNALITFSNIAIGGCLLVGLFTRFAAISGGLFLLSIVLSQPDLPFIYPPPHPSAGRALLINKEFVEMMALFALAATAVGRWGGLDFFVHYLLVRPLFGRGKRDESYA